MTLFGMTFAFLEERDYSLSYKMPFLLSFIDHMDTIGDAKIEDVLTDYIAFIRTGSIKDCRWIAPAALIMPRL